MKPRVNAVLILAVIATLMWSANVADPPGESTQTGLVWVLDNAESDFSSPHQDTLTLLNGDGDVISVSDDLGIMQTYGAHREISVSPDGQFAIVAQDLARKVSRYNASGDLDWSIQIGYPEDPSAVDVSASGHAYLLLYDTYVTGTRIMKLEASTGNVVGVANVSGFDLVVDDVHDTLWVVGKTITKLTPDLQVEFEMPVAPHPIFAVTVDYTSDGSIWTGIGPYATQHQLWKIAPDGDVTRIVDVPFKPAAIRVDRMDDSVWVSSGYVGQTGLYKYNQDGDLIRIVRDQPTWGIDIDRQDGSLWAADRGQTFLRKFSSGGDLIQDFSLCSGDQVWVAVFSSISADGDGDGVLDAADLCPDTIVPESVPTHHLGVNRWALVDEDGMFDTTLPPGGGNGPDFEFSLEDTGGCSCEQIIEAWALGQGHTKFGCSTGVMLQWIATVGGDEDEDNDEDEDGDGDDDFVETEPIDHGHGSGFRDLAQNVKLPEDRPVLTGRVKPSRRADGGLLEPRMTREPSASHIDLRSASDTADERTPALDRHLANLSRASTPDWSQAESRNALLTALGEGYGIEKRLKIVRGLVGNVDVAMNPLLERHLKDIRAEAAALGKEDLALRAERLLGDLERSEN